MGVSGIRFGRNRKCSGEIYSADCCASDDGDKCRTSKPERLRKRVKEQYRLVEYNELPEYLKDNEFILRHYRADWPLKHTLFSIFGIHNETLNIWTHLAGFLFFLFLTVYNAQKVPESMGFLPSWRNVSNLGDHNLVQSGIRASLSAFHSIAAIQNHFHVPEPSALCTLSQRSAGNGTNLCFTDVTKINAPFVQHQAPRWPFFVFMVGAMTCLLASSSCHLLSCHSASVSSFMLRLDYSGIAAMIATSFYPPIYYIFQCSPVWKNVYLIGITVLGFATVLISLIPALQRPKYRSLRTLLFVGMGGSGTIPAVHAVISNWHEPICFILLAYEIGMALCYIVGALIYVARVPERWQPGLFDITGHSHQIFHLLVIAGAYTHYQGGLTALDWRDAKGCPF